MSRDFHSYRKYARNGNSYFEKYAKTGYDIAKSNCSKKICNGIELQGKMAEIKKNGALFATCQVLSCGSDNSGIMIIVILKGDAPKEDVDTIGLFWKSLSIVQ